MELAALARRRYPDMELPLAVNCFESDRRRAGLGSLDARLRTGRKGVNNYKSVVAGRGQVWYHLVRTTTARMEYPRMDENEFRAFLSSFGKDDWGGQCVQLVQVPARNAHVRVPASFGELSQQSGRRALAAALRKARGQLRAPSTTEAAT